MHRIASWWAHTYMLKNIHGVCATFRNRGGSGCEAKLDLLVLSSLRRSRVWVPRSQHKVEARGTTLSTVVSSGTTSADS